MMLLKPRYMYRDSLRNRRVRLNKSRAKKAVLTWLIGPGIAVVIFSTLILTTDSSGVWLVSWVLLIGAIGQIVRILNAAALGSTIDYVLEDDD
jgi:hypothetical protein